MDNLNKNFGNVLYILKQHDIVPKYINKFMYLIEWKYILLYNKRLFNCKWERSQSNIIAKKSDIIIKNSSSESDDIIENIVLFTLEKLERLGYFEIDRLVMSTYPFIISNDFDTLDLLHLSKDYKSILNRKEKKSLENVIFGDKTTSNKKNNVSVLFYKIQNILKEIKWTF